MAPTTKKNKEVAPKGTILSFFSKGSSSATGSAAASSGTNGGSGARRSKEVVKAEMEDGETSVTSRAGRREAAKEKKVQRTSKGKGKEINGSANDPVVISDDDDITPLPGPSTAQPNPKRRKINSLAPSRQSTPSTPSSPKSTVCPPPFAGHPEFKPPPSWPQIINTAEPPSDEEDVPPSDEDDARTQDPGEGQMEEDDSGLEMEDDDQSSRRRRVELERRESGRSSVGGAGDMGWEEPEDEGMGMEDEDDVGDDVTVVDEPVSRKGTEKETIAQGDKVDQCPVCGASLKGKVNTVVQQHINLCLDSSTTTPTAPSSTNKSKAPRPVSAFSSFSNPPPSLPTTPKVQGGPNAFSVLMSGHKERDQWKDAEIDLKRDGKRTVGRRKAPFYKVMTGMPVAVDAFRYGAIPGVTAYLLTHAHSDHYTNLSKSWCHGPIYCSQTTANLIVHMLEVDRKWVHGLPNDVPFEMPNTGGVKVTPLEANHCPGSSLFLFEGPQTVNAGDSGFASAYVGSKRIFRYLHCGDFRANPKMVLHPAIARAPIHTCYLDTTYLNPKYCFPPQPQVIDACAALTRRTVVGASESAPSYDEVKSQAVGIARVKREDGGEMEVEVKPEEDKELAEDRSRGVMKGWLVKKEEEVKEEGEEGKEGFLTGKKKERTLVVVGTYSIGKERIVKAVAKAIGSKIYCDQRKKGILLCQTDPELHSMLSSDPIAAQVHLLPLGNIQLDRLEPYLSRLYPHFDRVLAFRPTGWSYSPPAGTDMLPDVNTVIKRDQARRFGEGEMKLMRGSGRQYMMYGVPYSEHSSFFELTCFALSLPGPDLKMIATVNVGNETSRGKMKKWFEKWLAEKARRKEKGLPAIVEYRDETYW
ncbi:hypothetical protein IAT38_001073 [Cryptococcus sp. DSM 104549]